MERDVEIDTGESVVFSYELAGLGSRFLALFIDTLLQFLVALGALFALVFIFSSDFWRTWTSHAQFHRVGGAVLLGATIFATFMLFFGYFIIIEWLWSGCTPGKRLIGIRVVRDGGFALDFIGSVIRNAVRALEFLLGFYLISGISMLLSAQNKRLGDFAAGTIVVRDVRFERYAPAKRGEREADDPAVRDLSARERTIIRQYAARCDALEPRARRELAAEIANHIRPRLGANFDYLGDDELLRHLANTAL